ncbi:hypothetical protein [Bacillus benzoevorans]|uniref:Uncharacterized protein YecA (UPF0149 family) n=1 Tax=Bacillus benzoevorans TaxID=1456 RepID=A0A7X0HTB4_9BACI|nr:hypothetical protein [Bacillus benzoevorans]MBB6445221.1 uncharacterized protein YecA (UPF0149 family) [Bacillus benzoevorans]
MSNQKPPKTELIVCSVKSELQAAQVTKICQDYGIQSIIKLKPYADISELKKTLKAKLKNRLYEPCPCGKGKKFKFCCYDDILNIKLYE